MRSLRYDDEKTGSGVAMRQDPNLGAIPVQVPTSNALLPRLHPKGKDWSGSDEDRGFHPRQSTKNPKSKPPLVLDSRFSVRRSQTPVTQALFRPTLTDWGRSAYASGRLALRLGTAGLTHRDGLNAYVSGAARRLRKSLIFVLSCQHLANRMACGRGAKPYVSGGRWVMDGAGHPC